MIMAYNALCLRLPNQKTNRSVNSIEQFVMRASIVAVLCLFHLPSAHAQQIACDVDPILTQVAKNFLAGKTSSLDTLKADAQSLGSDIAALTAMKSGNLTSQRTKSELEKLRKQYGVPVRCGVADDPRGRALVAAPDRGRL